MNCGVWFICYIVIVMISGLNLEQWFGVRMNVFFFGSFFVLVIWIFVISDIGGIMSVVSGQNMFGCVVFDDCDDIGVIG